MTVASMTPGLDGQLVAHAKNPIPSGAASGLFKGHDGAALRYAVWEASRSPRQGTVCLFGGRGEYIEKYFETIADLRRRGFAVATMDWRGQGGSMRTLANPRKGHIVDFRDYDLDLVRFMKDIVLPDCPPPYIALGHSTGGNILLRNAQMEGSWFDRMVLSAPLIRFAPRSLPASQEMVKVWAEIVCLLGLNERYARKEGDDLFESMRFEGNELTSDYERFNRNIDVLKIAPSIGLGAPTYGWIRAACRSMKQIGAPEYPSKIKVPLLLIAAGSDQIVCRHAIENFAMRLKVGTHVLLSNSQHEILQERNEIRQQFWATFDAYILGDKQAAPKAF